MIRAGRDSTKGNPGRHISDPYPNTHKSAIVGSLSGPSDDGKPPETVITEATDQPQAEAGDHTGKAAEPRRPGRHLRIAAGTLCTLVVLWTIAWFVGARWIGQRIDETIATATAAGAPVVCGNRSLGGFPLKVSVSCDRFSIKTPAGERVVSLGHAEAAALAFPPGRITAALATPASAAWDGRAVALDWQSATAEIDSLSGLRESRAEFVALEVGFDKLTISAATATAALGPAAEAPMTTIAIASADTVVETEGRPTAPFRFTAEASLTVPPAALLSGAFDPAEDGLSVPRFILRAESGSAAVVIDGTLTAGTDGLADGAFTLTLIDPNELYTWLDSLPQELADMGSVAMSLAAFMGEPVETDGADGLRLHFTIEAGAIGIGGNPLAQIPPLY